MSAAHDLTEFVSNYLFLADPPSDEPACPICYEEWQPPGRPHQEVVSTECKHTYHLECLITWLTGDNYTCPSCRRVLYGDDDLVESEYGEYGEYDEYESDSDADSILLSDVCQYADSFLYLNALSILERLVIEGIQQIDLAASTDPDRFTDAVQPIIDYVIPRYKEKYCGCLWDPLPRQPVRIDDSALECCTLTAMIKICNTMHPYNYVGMPITPGQSIGLRNVRRARLHENANRWDPDEHWLVETGFILCNLRLSDFFSRRHRDDLPVGSIITFLDPYGRWQRAEGGDDLPAYFGREPWMNATNESTPVRYHFTQAMMATTGTLLSVEVKEEARTNTVALKFCDGYMFEAKFLYRTEKRDSEDYFEPSLF